MITAFALTSMPVAAVFVQAPGCLRASIDRTKGYAPFYWEDVEWVSSRGAMALKCSSVRSPKRGTPTEAQLEVLLTRRDWSEFSGEPFAISAAHGDCRRMC